MITLYQVCRVEKYEAPEVMVTLLSQQQAEEAKVLLIEWDKKIAALALANSLRFREEMIRDLGEDISCNTNIEDYYSQFEISPLEVHENIEEFVLDFNKEKEDGEKMVASSTQGEGAGNPDS